MPRKHSFHSSLIGSSVPDGVQIHPSAQALFARSPENEEALDIERICRILVRFAQLTEEIDRETTEPLSTQE